MPRLILSPKLATEIGAHAERDYPLETCGILIGAVEGDSYVVRGIHAAENHHPEDRGHRYQVDRSTYEAAEKVATKSGLAVVGVFHSHPDSDPVPSEIDSEFAFPGWVYLIVRVENGRPGETKAWLRRTDMTTWTQCEVDAVKDGGY